MTEDKVREQVCYSERKNNIYYMGSARKSFCCLEINIPKDSDFMRKVCDKAREIAPKLNPKGANNSEVRDEWKKLADSYSGMIAEYACERILTWLYGEGKIIKPESSSSRNQIDIKLKNGKTIEVRSSCVRNGLDFALFKRNKDHPEQQYFDVIGPYVNEYKPGESFKNYYMRVLYACNIDNFIEILQDETRKYMTLYITGGVTMEMMQNKEYYQIKHLFPKDGQVEKESDYQVIPLAKSLDAREFLHRLEQDNGMKPLHSLDKGELYG